MTWFNLRLCHKYLLIIFSFLFFFPLMIQHIIWHKTKNYNIVCWTQADIVLRGYSGWNSRRALQVIDKVFPKVLLLIFSENYNYLPRKFYIYINFLTNSFFGLYLFIYLFHLFNCNVECCYSTFLSDSVLWW